MWISRTSLVLALLASCNWAYGLDSTVLGVDTDQDGIIDGRDNCPTIENPDQLDSNDIDDGGDACAQCPNIIGIDLDEDNYDDGCDRCLGPGPSGVDSDGDDIDDGCDPCVAGTSQFAIDFNGNGIGDGCEVCFEPPQGDSDQDGLDDACDKCMLGPPHDEDGDGIDDGCDNCPFDPNPDQTVGMPNSTVGLACDGGALAIVVQLLFDPFLVRDIFRWTGVSGAWSQLTDRTAVTEFGARTVAASFAGEFRFVMRVRLPTALSRVSVAQTSITSPQNQVCEVTRAGEVTFANKTAAIPVTDDPITLELLETEGDLLAVTKCVVHSGGQIVTVQGLKISEATRIVIQATSIDLYAVGLVAAPPKATTN